MVRQTVGTDVIASIKGYHYTDKYHCSLVKIETVDGAVLICSKAKFDHLSVGSKINILIEEI